MYIAGDWKDYEVPDTGGGEKLERWGDIILRRPDPQIIWPLTQETAKWRDVHGHYHRSSSGGGQWEMKKTIPDDWKISYGKLKFNLRPTNFKHTGLFPEQAANWSWMMDKIAGANRPVSYLICSLIRAELLLLLPVQVRRLFMLTQPRAWYSGQKKISSCLVWASARSASSLTTFSNSSSVNSAAAANTMPLLWTLRPMDAVQEAKCGSWNPASTLSSRAAWRL